MEAELVFIRHKDISEVLLRKQRELVVLIEDTLESYSNRQVVQPLSPSTDVHDYNGKLVTMTAFDNKSKSLAAKVLAIYPKNKDKNIPTHHIIILLFDASNGVLKAVLDGNLITYLRTAAASMVATKYLCKKDIKYMAIIGSGAQARSHYQIMKHFYKFEMVFVWNINKSSGQKFVDEMKNDGQKCKLCETVQEAVKEADIINVVTYAKKPILKKEWVREGAHINAIGALSAQCQELEEDLVLSSILYVDSRERALKYSGDIIKSGASIYSEIGEVISGKKQALFNKTTLFKSIGMAAQDAVTAEFVYKNYSQQKNVCDSANSTLGLTRLQNKM